MKKNFRLLVSFLFVASIFIFGCKAEIQDEVEKEGDSFFLFQIALEPNTTERTNKDVVITVNATTDVASKIKKITYVEGTESKIDTVLAGIDITE